MFGVLTVFGEGALCGYGVMSHGAGAARLPRDLSGPHLPYEVRDIVSGRVLRDAGPPGWGWSRAARSGAPLRVPHARRSNARTMLVAKNERSAPYPDGCVQEVAERLRLVGGDASGQALTVAPCKLAQTPRRLFV